MTILYLFNMLKNVLKEADLYVFVPNNLLLSDLNSLKQKYFSLKLAEMDSVEDFHHI